MPESTAARERRLKRLRAKYAASPEAYSRAAAEWRAAHPGAMAAYASAWRKVNPSYMREWSRRRRLGIEGPFTAADGPTWQERNRTDYLERKRENTNRRRREMSLEALRHYSGGEPRCYCCGESIPALLGLDHINGGGSAHRKELKRTRLAIWAKRNGWPPIFRVACHSCNLGAHLNGGSCPHLTHPERS